MDCRFTDITGAIAFMAISFKCKYVSDDARPGKEVKSEAKVNAFG